MSTVADPISSLDSAAAQVGRAASVAPVTAIPARAQQKTAPIERQLNRVACAFWRCPAWRSLLRSFIVP